MAFQWEERHFKDFFWILLLNLFWGAQKTFCGNIETDFNLKFQDDLSLAIGYFSVITLAIFCEESSQISLTISLLLIVGFQILCCSTFLFVFGRCTFFSWLHFSLSRRQRNPTLEQNCGKFQFRLGFSFFTQY